ncbi:hypothetical protein IID20_00075 [Patescibacteria group bacterium]|nr:hypothetical protein [Patescibacteria group bacterium]
MTNFEQKNKFEKDSKDFMGIIYFTDGTQTGYVDIEDLERIRKDNKGRITQVEPREQVEA